MVDFRPFRGVLPHLSKGEDIADRVSPPYDIISAEEQAKLQAKPCNITRITLGAVDGRYEQAAGLLDSWLSSGKLVQDKEECYYLYRQGFKDGERWLTRNGIIGVLRSEGYEAGNIIPHEETFPKVKEDRLNLLRATATHCESIFGLYDRSEVDMSEVEKSATKLFECTDVSGTRHQLYRISDRGMVEAIQAMVLMNVKQFASELGLTPERLQEQLQSAGVGARSPDETLSEQDKSQLLDFLKRAHGISDESQITVTRKQTSEIRTAGGTVRVETRKKRVVVRPEDPSTAPAVVAAESPEPVPAAPKAAPAPVSKPTPEVAEPSGEKPDAPAEKKSEPVVVADTSEKKTVPAEKKAAVTEVKKPAPVAPEAAPVAVAKEPPAAPVRPVRHDIAQHPECQRMGQCQGQRAGTDLSACQPCGLCGKQQ